MTYQYPNNDNQGYGGVPSYYQTQNASQYSYPTSNYDPVALQLRIVRAKQVNLMCKQNLVRSMILNNNVSTSQARHDVPSYQSQNFFDNQQRLAFPQQQQLLRSQDESEAKRNSTLPLLQRDFRNDGRQQAATPSTIHSSHDSSVRAEPSRSDVPAAVQRGQPQNSKPSTRESHHRPTEVGDDEDHSIPFEEHTSSAAPLRPREDVKILSSLAENMAQTVSDNTEALKKITAARKKIAQAPTAEKAKKKIEQMIKVNASAPPVMPLWRHKMNGRFDPQPETILKGVRLFRLVARALLNFIVKPTVASIKRSLVVRESERKDLQKTLKIVAGGIDDWIGKLVQLPVSSIAQDNTLNFEPVETFVGNTQPLRVRMLQLKVRLRGAITNIAKSDMPSDFVTDFLVTLIEENNYFTAGLLWDCEIAQLDFTSMGATKDVAPELSAEQLAHGSYTESDYVRIPSEERVGEEVVLPVLRARMLLVRFIFVRALVNHIILSPWNYNLCGDPSSRSLKRTIYNHRVLATAVYELVRTIDPSLPAIEARTIAQTHATSPTAHKAGSKEGSKFIAKNANSRAIGASLVSVANNARLPIPGSAASTAATSLDASTISSPRSPTGMRSGISSRVDLSPALTSPQHVTASGGVSSRIPAAAQLTSINTTAAEDASEGVDPQFPAVVAPSQSSLLVKLSRLMGMSDTTPGVDVLSKGSIESFLLEPRREEFTSLPAVHALLIPPAQLGPLKAQLEEWFAELKGLLSEWLQRLVKHVLARRMHQKLIRDRNAL